jgi:hypothetical protein
MKPKPKVGDVLIARRPKGRWQDESVVNAKVTSVRRLYMTLDRFGNTKFRMDTWQQADSNACYNHPIELYRSKDEMLDEILNRKQLHELKIRLQYSDGWQTLTNEQISAIHRIVYP